MRHVLKSHTVEAFQIPKGAKVTVKLPHQPLQCGEGGDYLLLGQGEPAAPTIGVLDRAGFEARYELTAAPADLVPTTKQRRGGKRPGPKAGRKAAKKAKATPPIRRVGSTKAPAPGKRSRYPAEQISEARRLVEGGTSIKDTAEQLGLKYNTVYMWAKANGWDS